MNDEEKAQLDEEVRALLPQLLPKMAKSSVRLAVAGVFGKIVLIDVDTGVWHALDMNEAAFLLRSMMLVTREMDRRGPHRPDQWPVVVQGAPRTPKERAQERKKNRRK